jgi:hypothetical protein
VEVLEHADLLAMSTKMLSAVCKDVALRVVIQCT